MRSAGHRGGADTGAQQHDDHHPYEVSDDAGDGGDERVEPADHADYRRALSFDERHRAGERDDDGLQQVGNLDDAVLE